MFIFKILKEIVGSYDILKDYLERIPIYGYLIPSLNTFCNELLYYVYHHEVLGNSGGIRIDFNGKTFALKVPEKYSVLLEGLELTDPAPDIISPSQYDYTNEEFKMLLFDFIDILKRVEN